MDLTASIPSVENRGRVDKMMNFGFKVVESSVRHLKTV